jgi:polyisoprenoid-binding protein YceI
MAGRRRTNRILIPVAVAIVLIGGAYAAFAFFAGGGSPAPVSLSTTPGGVSSPSAIGSPGGGPTSASDLAGTWELSSNDSFVGYRVREKLGFLPAPSDAVGRTSAVQGSLTIAGTTLRSVKITADLTQLQSSESRRDERMRTIGLQTDRFPTATFELSSPISFDAAPAEGKVVTTEATGNLTIHGVTRRATFRLQAKWTADGIVAVGSIPIVMADYAITPPNVGGFVTVQDLGTMEFQLVFVRA